MKKILIMLAIAITLTSCETEPIKSDCDCDRVISITDTKILPNGYFISQKIVLMNDCTKIKKTLTYSSFRPLKLGQCLNDF